MDEQKATFTMLIKAFVKHNENNKLKSLAAGTCKVVTVTGSVICLPSLQRKIESGTCVTMPAQEKAYDYSTIGCEPGDRATFDTLMCQSRQALVQNWRKTDQSKI